MSAGPIKVLIVDDHALLRRGLIDLLGNVDAIEVVGETTDGNEGVEKAKALEPDVVMMDLHMPGCDGVEGTRRLRAEVPQAKVLILTVSDKDKDLVAAAEAGANGYMLKNEDQKMLVQAIEVVAAGSTWLSPTMVTRMAEDSGATEIRP
jgi:DNA-binding NarL/FixJ family response regulator